MARVNVEQKALTDPRFRILGNRLDPLHQATPQDIDTAFGLMLAIRVWGYAQERGTDKLPGTFIEGIYPGLTDAMLDADLVEQVDDRTVRVKGWTESDGGWLERQRRSSRAGGVARSAGSKRRSDGTFLPAASSDHPADLDQRYPAVSSALTPAPAPAPAPEQEPEEEKTKPPDRLASSLGFDEFWQEYPARNGKKVGKADSLQVWRSRKLATLRTEVMAGLRSQIAHAERCEAAGAFCAPFPDPKRWLARSRWSDEVGAAPESTQTKNARDIEAWARRKSAEI